MSKSQIKGLFAFILAFLLIGLSLILIFFDNKAGFLTDLYKEVFKFAIMSCLGAVLLEKYQHAKAEQNELFQFSKETRGKLTNIHLRVKRARWELKANHRNGCIETKLYYGCVYKLVDLKSEIEALQFDVEHYVKLESSLRDASRTLNDKIR